MNIFFKEIFNSFSFRFGIFFNLSCHYYSLLFFFAGNLATQHRFAGECATDLAVVNRCRDGTATEADMLILNRSRENADSNSTELVTYVNQTIANRVVKGSQEHRNLEARYNSEMNLRPDRHGTYFGVKHNSCNNVADFNVENDRSCVNLSNTTTPTVTTVIIASENIQVQLYNSIIPKGLQGNKTETFVAQDLIPQTLACYGDQLKKIKKRLTEDTKLIENITVCNGMMGKITVTIDDYLAKNKLFTIQVRYLV